MCFVTFVPGLNGLFEISEQLVLNPKMIGYIVLFALVPTILIQIAKMSVEIYKMIKAK